MHAEMLTQILTSTDTHMLWMRKFCSVFPGPPAIAHKRLLPKPHFTCKTNRKCLDAKGTKDTAFGSAHTSFLSKTWSTVSEPSSHQEPSTGVTMGYMHYSHVMLK